MPDSIAGHTRACSANYPPYHIKTCEIDTVVH